LSSASCAGRMPRIAVRRHREAAALYDIFSTM
jgi:hypothetical protein